MGRRIRRLASATAAAATVLVTAAIPASAAIDFDPLDCTPDPPAVESPSSTAGNVFDKGPDNPRPGDPFADQPTTTIYETYGYAGLMFDAYDLGCGPDIVAGPEATVDTWVANKIQAASQWMVGLSAALTRWALNPSGWTAPLDAMVERVVGVFTQPALIWFPVALIILGLIVAFRSRQARYAETADRLKWGMVAVFAGIFLMGQPLWAAQSLDGVVATGVDTVRAQLTAGTGPDADLPDPGVGIIASKHRNILYETWVAGTFGNAESPCAQRFAPRVFDASARTLDEDRRAVDDADYRDALTSEKADQFTEVASEIKDFDGGCYAHFTGNTSNRVEVAAVGFLSAGVTSVFDALAALMIVAGYIMVRVLVMVGLGLVIVGVFRPSVMVGPVVSVFGVVLNAFWFGIAVGVFALAQQALLGSELPAWGVAVLILLTAVLFWRLTKAVRRTDPTGEVSARSRRAGRWLWRTAQQYAITRAAVDHAIDDEPEPEPVEEEQDDSQNAAAPPTAGPEQPVYTPALPAGPTRTVTGEPVDEPASADDTPDPGPTVVEPEYEDGTPVYPIYTPTEQRDDADEDVWQ